MIVTNKVKMSESKLVYIYTYVTQGCTVPLLLLIYPMILSAEFLQQLLIPKECKNDRRGLVPSLPPLYNQ